MIRFPDSKNILGMVCLGIGFALGATPSLQLKRYGPQPTGRQFVTMGYVFAQGDIPAGKSLSAKTASGATVPIQVDAKATHGDGSLRHAVLTFEETPALGASESVTLAPVAAPTGNAAPAAADLLAGTYDAVATLVVSGVSYTASAKAALQAAVAAGKVQTWLCGPLVSEWLVSVPFKSAAGAAHPHLVARFAIRAYAGLKSVRTDLTVENCWAYEPNPQGYTYSVDVSVGGKSAYSKAGLRHTHHARWRKLFWWGDQPGLDAEPNQEYWFSTGSLPNYDRSVKVPEATIAALATDFEPMSNGDLSSYMPETGAQDDIGPLPRTAAIYLLTLDPRARANVLANGMAGGGFQIHYRDKAKDMPISIDDYPYMTILGNPEDTRNPATGKTEAFPDVTNDLEAFTPDDAHQPSIAYLPYMISGDYFFLEELQFWAGWNLLIANPAYRQMDKGLVSWTQVRGQAWSMRTLGHAAYITPDAHPLKSYFTQKLHNNIDFYSKRYVGSATVNKLGWLDAGHALVYDPYGIAPWQDDFFTWTIGHLTDLGFGEAKPFLQWKGKFVVGRMIDPGACWLEASAYSLQVGTADGKTEFTNFAAITALNFTGLLCTGNSMSGYPDSPTGYPANMQPALAAAVDAGVPGATEAWAKYQTRNPKQDYTQSPQFAVIPGLVAQTAVRPEPKPGKPRVAPRMEIRAKPAKAAFLRSQGGMPERVDANGRP